MNWQNDGLLNPLEPFVPEKCEMARPERFELPTY